MQVALVFLALCLLSPAVLGDGAGRAFPINSENYVIEQFQFVNGKIEWDPTNFLVDLSGNFANCKNIGVRGEMEVGRNTPEGVTIGAVVDWVQGSEAHTNAVNNYIKTVIDNWMREGAHDGQIRKAARFGCSVRPGCKGYTSVACLFSPGGNSEPPQGIDDGRQRALAFTNKQYDEAEFFTGNAWDRSHFLENLSGYETQCSMIVADKWDFPTATTKAAQRGMRVLGLFGSARNEGSTPSALADILSEFKEISHAEQVGCSIIPDCDYEKEMWVVVSCVYQE